MKDRIRQLMDDQHLTQQNFAQLIGISTATLSSIFNDRTKPSLLIVDAIHRKFPQVRLEWLLDGSLPIYINNVEGGAENAPATDCPTPGSEASGWQPGASAVSPAGHGTSVEATLDFGSADGSTSTASPSLFDQPQVHGVNRTPKNISQTAVKITDKPQRKITEIRIFYDDQTWETFVPKK